MYGLDLNQCLSGHLLAQSLLAGPVTFSFRSRPRTRWPDRITALRCERCQHHAPLACAVAVIRKLVTRPKRAKKQRITSNETVMLHVLIFFGLAIILVGMTATTRKPQRMTKDAITRGWLRDALDEALSEDKPKPSPVQQFAFNVKHGKPHKDKAA